MEPLKRGVSVKKLNSSGFGLVEVMIAAALLTILAIGFSQVVMNGMRGSGAVTANADASSLSAIINLVNQNNAACTNSIFRAGVSYTFNTAGIVNNAATFTAGNPTVTLTHPLVFNDGANTPIVTNGAAYGNEFKVTKLELDVLATLTAGQNYLANIHVEVTKQGQSIVGANTLARDIPISLLTQWVTPPGPGPVQIIGCAQNVNILTCPVGQSVVGNPILPEAFCIDSAPRGSAPWLNAMGVCAGANAHACSTPEWEAACQTGVITPVTWEWIPDFDDSSCNCILRVGPGCTSVNGDSMGNSNPFRCCHK